VAGGGVKRSILLAATIAVVACLDPDPVRRGAPAVAKVEVEIEPKAETETEPQGKLIRAKNNKWIWYPIEQPPPDPELSDEALAALAKHKGTLTWHPDAPEGGQWEYQPTSDCGWGHDQYDEVASIAVILAASEADNECRICGPKKKGRWVDPGPPPEYAGCTDEQWAEIESLYCATACRLERDGFPPGEGWWCDGMC